MKYINLTKGKRAIVDDEDYEHLIQYNWHDGGRYAVRKGKRGVEKSTVYMHKELIGVPQGMFADHINHNTYDNRRSNLRVATYTQNNQNALTRKDNKAGYKGVHYRTKSRDFVAYIQVNGKRIHLKTYRKIEDAIAARKAAEAKYHGDFALCRSQI